MKPSELKNLTHLYRRKLSAESFATPEVTRTMTELSLSMNRQVGLMVDRAGAVTHVIVGDAHKIFLPDFGRLRTGHQRFRGLRLLLTHLHGEGVTRDNLTDLALLRLDLLLVVQVLADGLPGGVEYAHLIPPNPAGELHRVEQVRSIHDLRESFPVFIRELEAEFSRTVDKARASDTRERAILIGLATRERPHAEESLEELKRLADTAGLKVVEAVLQKRPQVDPKYVVGRGKLEEIIVRAMQAGVDVVIFDADLRPSQLRSISERTDLKVLDRTQLILDIFAQHAESRAGKLQVEVAQLRYLLPRLNIMNTAMSRLTGGIGGRGPGETKLEINRRRARERLTRMNRELAGLERERQERRKGRQRAEIPVVALVGYTNAGKSTLLNTLTRSSVRAEDRLFATLDPVSRRLRFPEEREIILTDTVGFIQDLPPDLLAAFKATLEEVVQSDLLIHLVDASTPDPERHLRAVETILEALDVLKTPRLLVWNKSDLLSTTQMTRLLRTEGGVGVSAATGEGLQALLLAIERALWKPGAAPEDLEEGSSLEDGSGPPSSGEDEALDEGSSPPEPEDMLEDDGASDPWQGDELEEEDDPECEDDGEGDDPDPEDDEG